jgi:hypothetical protein
VNVNLKNSMHHCGSQLVYIIVGFNYLHCNLLFCLIYFSNMCLLKICDYIDDMNNVDIGISI